ncbi:hypothetical protein G9A89_016837 [Geosiphon pyriformis]|nr:hypothetical protein G9A89_016837 [Geosiphon pyriformis]
MKIILSNFNPPLQRHHDTNSSISQFIFKFILNSSPLMVRSHDYNYSTSCIYNDSRKIFQSSNMIQILSYGPYKLPLFRANYSTRYILAPDHPSIDRRTPQHSFYKSRESTYRYPPLTYGQFSHNRISFNNQTQDSTASYNQIHQTKYKNNQSPTYYNSIAQLKDYPAHEISPRESNSSAPQTRKQTSYEAFPALKFSYIQAGRDSTLQSNDQYTQSHAPNISLHHSNTVNARSQLLRDPQSESRFSRDQSLTADDNFCYSKNSHSEFREPYRSLSRPTYLFAQFQAYYRPRTNADFPQYQAFQEESYTPDFLTRPQASDTVMRQSNFSKYQNPYRPTSISSQRESGSHQLAKFNPLISDSASIKVLGAKDTNTQPKYDSYSASSARFTPTNSSTCSSSEDTALGVEKINPCGNRYAYLGNSKALGGAFYYRNKSGSFYSQNHDGSVLFIDKHGTAKYTPPVKNPRLLARGKDRENFY